MDEGVCMNKGYATAEATRAYVSKYKWLERKEEQNQVFNHSPIALGNHLGTFSDEDSQKYKEAMSYALLHGINVLDTAINYRGMKSEKDTGEVLQELISTGQICRDEVIVCTKAGLLFGDITARLRPKDYLEKNLLHKGICMSDFHEYEGLLHTLNTDFYREAIEISMGNLGIETIDIHYIHIPEISRAVLGEEVFYDQMYSLFVCYEDMVKQGKIRYYGLALEMLCMEPEEEKWTFSLEKLCSMADEITNGESHFHFVQLPWNQRYQSAAELKKQIVAGEPCTLLEAIQKLGMEAVGSMPFDFGEGFVKNTLTDMLSFCLGQKEISWVNCGSKNIVHIREMMDALKKE